MKKRVLRTWLLLVLASPVLFLTGCTKTADPTGNNGNNNNNSNTPTPTTLVYQNDAFTPILITVNGVSATIAVGGTASFTGTPGATVSGTATTSGLTSNNGVVGLVISWAITDQFPATGSSTKLLDVNSQYFFLKINNTSSFAVSGVYVNYGLVPQTFDNITFGTGLFNIGYYQAYSNTDIRCISPSGTYWQGGVVLPNTANQSYIFTLLN